MKKNVPTVICTQACFWSDKEKKWYLNSGYAGDMTDDRLMFLASLPRMVDISSSETTENAKSFVKVTW